MSTSITQQGENGKSLKIWKDIRSVQIKTTQMTPKYTQLG